jgi:hypothetical protein
MKHYHIKPLKTYDNRENIYLYTNILTSKSDTK